MNSWIIVGIIVGLLVIGGIAVVSAISVSRSDSADTAKCTSCGGKCTAEKNCGSSTCGAITDGKCNCGR